MQVDAMEKAQRGAKLLDEMKPDWVQNIRLETLDIRDGSECVLGQIFGEYSDGINKIWLFNATREAGYHPFNSQNHGFLVDYEWDTPYEVIDCLSRNLIEAWGNEVRIRSASRIGSGSEEIW
jgi:hypothetical protein